VLDGKIRDFLLRQRLGYVATVSPDGSPNLSPKGTILVWDETHLVVADIRSPQTVKNLESDPRLEVNVVDPLSRRGYRFRGTGRILERSSLYGDIIAFYRGLGIRSRISGIILVTVDSADEVTSPLYDAGMSEEEIRRIWRARLLSG